MPCATPVNPPGMFWDMCSSFEEASAQANGLGSGDPHVDCCCGGLPQRPAPCAADPNTKGPQPASCALTPPYNHRKYLVPDYREGPGGPHATPLVLSWAARVLSRA